MKIQTQRTTIFLFFTFIIFIFFSNCKSTPKKTTEKVKTEVPTTTSKEKKEIKEPQKTVGKPSFVGAWIEPIPGHESDYQGFVLKEDGTAFTINMATLHYEKWTVNGNKITFTIRSIGNHTSSRNDETWEILKIDKNNMELKLGNEIVKMTRNDAAQYPTTNIKPHQKISSPLAIDVNSRGVWFAFEGEIGYVEVMDDKNHVLNKDLAVIAANGEWMTSKAIDCTALVKFDPKGAKKGKIVFYKTQGGADDEDAGPQVSFEIPVRF